MGLFPDAKPGSWIGRLDALANRLELALWNPKRVVKTPGRRALRRTAQAAYVTVQQYFAHQGPLRVASLTNKTFLSLVPLLATLFVILKTMGVQEALGDTLIARVTAGSEEASRAIGDYIGKTVEFINKTNVHGLAWLGGAGLFIVSITMLRTVEQAMNVIWEAPKARSIQRMVADYISLIIITPIVLAAGTYVTAMLKQPHTGVPLAGLIDGVILLPVLTVLPWMTSCAVFYSIYSFMPNVRVRARSALIGGVAGGSAWHAAQSIYVHYSLRWFGNKYNAIYESFAWVFILMLWVSISWTILLIGAELAAAHQYLDRHRRRYRPWSGTAEEQESLGLRLATLLATAVAEPLPNPAHATTVEEACDLLGVPEEPVRRFMGLFENVGLVARVEGRAEDSPAFFLCRSPEEVSVLDVLRLARHGSLDPASAPHFEEKMLFEAERDFSAWLAGRKLSSLAGSELGDVRTFILRERGGAGAMGDGPTAKNAAGEGV